MSMMFPSVSPTEGICLNAHTRGFSRPPIEAPTYPARSASCEAMPDPIEEGLGRVLRPISSAREASY